MEVWVIEKEGCNLIGHCEDRLKAAVELSEIIELVACRGKTFILIIAFSFTVEYF